jgi:hypothetical protein
MDQKMAAYLAKQLVGMVSSDKNVNPELRRVLQDLMGADMKTVQHRLVDVDEEWGVGGVPSPPFLHGESAVDYVTVVDANGRTRHLIFL